MVSRSLIISIAGMALFYIIFAIYSNLTQVVKSFVSMRLDFIPIILVLILISVIIRGVRQQYILKSNQITIPFKENLFIYLAGLSLIFTPGGIGGIVKTKFFKDDHGIPIRNTIPVVIMELYHEFLGLVSLVGITLLFYNFIESKIAFIIGICFITAVYASLKYQKVFERSKKILLKINLFKKAMEEGEESQRSFHRLTSPRNMLVIWTFTIIAMIFDLLSIYFIFLSFNIKQLNFILESQSYLSSFLLGQITFLPNGIGVTDVSFIGILAARKLDLAVATSVVFAVRFISLWTKTGIGLVALKIIHREKISSKQ